MSKKFLSYFYFHPSILLHNSAHVCIIIINSKIKSPNADANVRNVQLRRHHREARWDRRKRGKALSWTKTRREWPDTKAVSSATRIPDGAARQTWHGAPVDCSCRRSCRRYRPHTSRRSRSGTEAWRPSAPRTAPHLLHSRRPLCRHRLPCHSGRLLHNSICLLTQHDSDLLL